MDRGMPGQPGPQLIRESLWRGDQDHYGPAERGRCARQCRGDDRPCRPGQPSDVEL